jgi:hypothetical protein
MDPERHNDEGPKELKHEPVPGYPAAFYITVAASVIYLIYVFLF